MTEFCWCDMIELQISKQTILSILTTSFHSEVLLLQCEDDIEFLCQHLEAPPHREVVAWAPVLKVLSAGCGRLTRQREF